MIKRIFLFLSVVFLSAFAKAQIQRNFDGIVLGKATKNEIVNYTNKIGLYPYEKYGGKTIQAIGDISFGGAIWNKTTYYLYNGILYKIVYTRCCGHQVGAMRELDNFYYRLRNRLLKKYTHNKLPSSNAVIPNNLFIKGKNTTVEIKRKYSDNSGYYVKLIYTDIELNKKAKMKADNDL